MKINKEEGCVNMTNTEMLRQYIEDKYGSVRKFTVDINMPYTTLHSIFRRGIENSSVANINRICKELQISMPDLLDNRIVPVTEITLSKKKVNGTLDDLVLAISKLSPKQQKLLLELLNTN